MSNNDNNNRNNEDDRMDVESDDESSSSSTTDPPPARINSLSNVIDNRNNNTTNNDISNNNTTNNANSDDDASSSSSSSVITGRSSSEQENLKRKAIQKIMADPSLNQKVKQLQIQALMNGSSSCSAANSASASSFGGFSTNSTTTSSSSGGAGGSSRSLRTNSMIEEVVSCLHYERNCNIVAPCCNKVFGCRICHDNLKTHEGDLDRFTIREVVCKECNTRQERSNKCTKCNITFAEYHCSKCNLWMGMSKKPFHCEQCGICRIGGASNFRHCPECCMCIAVSTFDTHNCLKDKYKNSCSVCLEDLFSSRKAPIDLPCGHVIHSHCFRTLANFDYRCPICKKTVGSQDAMSNAWETRAADIAAQPMPVDLRKQVAISCFDCQEKSDNLSWHFLGVQCPACNSFNTVVDDLASRRSGMSPAGSSS